MNKSSLKYRLIIAGVFFICIFLFHHFYTSFGTGKYSSQTTQPKTAELNRNIDHLIFSMHARCRMECRDITEDEIMEILHNGNINYNKSDLNDKRGATYALEGYIHERQHIRIIVAPKKNELVVVTCIDLDKEWHCNCN